MSYSQDDEPKKLHTVTVCMVPPPECEYVWKVVSDMRRQLKDPGFYRWPPHANLLYPFIDLSSDENNIQETVQKLQEATSQCEPFRVTLDQFGTFGGKKRGVLWLNPKSTNSNGDNDNSHPPLVILQQKLEEAFPMCKDQSQKGDNSFTPHMTLSHFKNLKDALQAQDTLSINEPLEFIMDRIYLLERKGDAGQFLRVAQVGLGSNTITEIFEPPCPFPGMPEKEEDWVREERMKLKARRNWRRGGKQRRSRSGQPRIPDTPEVIAAKRAERKAKRERLEQQLRNVSNNTTS